MVNWILIEFFFPFSGSRNNTLSRDVTPPNASIQSATSSVSSLSMDSTSNGQPNKNAYNHYNGSNSHSTNHQYSQMTTKNSMSSSSSSSAASMQPAATGANQHHISSSASNHFHIQPNSPLKNQSPDFYIIRVTYETDNIELDGIVLYKSIMLGNNERTPQVIKNAMLKLGLEGDPDKYTLAQVLPEKELIMPPNANVYYAVNTAFNLNFILRHKRDA